MNFHKLRCLSFLLFCFSCNGQSNSPKIIRTIQAEGKHPDFDTTLVSQYFRSIFQDSKENLWFGSLGEGVVKYDKATLRYFTASEGFKNSSVQAIAEDKNGNMWFGTDEGVYKFDGKTFKNYNQKNGLGHNDISRKSIVVDKSNTVWVGTPKGVFRYIPSADSAGGQCFTRFNLLPDLHIKGLMEDRNGNIWMATAKNGVYKFDGKSLLNLTKEGLGDNYAGGMAEDPKGDIWFTMKGGICRFDGKNFTEFTNKDGIGGGPEIWGIYIEKSGIVWITARGNTTRFDPSLPLEQAFRVFTPVDGLNCCVQSMAQDKAGNMWWGAGAGLFRFDGKRFYQVKKNGPW